MSKPTTNSFLTHCYLLLTFNPGNLPREGRGEEEKIPIIITTTTTTRQKSNHEL